MKYSEFLSALSTAAGGRMDLTPDADGIVRLEAGELSLAYREQEDHPVRGHRAILMWGRFGTVPAEGADALVAEMLRANDRADDPSGATVALVGDTLYLQRTLSAELLDAESSVEVTGGFVAELVAWRDRVADFRPVASADAADETASGPSGVTRTDDAERQLAVFRCIVGKMPERGAERFRRAMLHANFMGGDTAGACLGVTAAGEIVLSLALPLVLTGDETAAEVTRRMSDMAQEWRCLVADYAPVAVRQEAEADESRKLARRLIISAGLRV